jgi:glyoxylase-like metal-dependent hydrolase (beta-lactamase superfamily II)
VYTIKPLRNSHLTTQGPVIFLQNKVGENVTIFGWIFLLERDGKKYLVDTGIGQPSQAVRRRFAFVIEPGEDTLGLLQTAGVAPEEIEGVILTHLHWDHCSNVALFPNATFYVSRRGWHDVVEAPRHPLLYSPRVFPPAAYNYLKNSGRLVLLDDEDEPLPDIRTFWIGGHTPCCQAVKVLCAGGQAIITSDTVSTWEHLEKNIAPASLFDLPQCFEAYDRIRAEADIILPTHEPNLAAAY